MNTSLAYTRPDADTEPTVEVPATGVYVVDQGETYAVDQQRVEHAVCECENGLHELADRSSYAFALPYARHLAAIRPGGHVVAAYTYVVVGRVIA